MRHNQLLARKQYWILLRNPCVVFFSSQELAESVSTAIVILVHNSICLFP